MLHAKHFGAIETKILTKPHTSFGLKYVELRGNTVVLAIDGRPIVQSFTAAAAKHLTKGTRFRFYFLK